MQILPVPFALLLALPPQASGIRFPATPRNTNSQKATSSAPYESSLEAALRLESEGRHQKSLAAFRGLLTATLGDPTADISPAMAARAEFLLTKTVNLTLKSGDHKGQVEFLAELVKRPDVGKRKILLSWLQHHQVESLLRTGQLRKATEVIDALGYVKDFWVIGPLDNERGAGLRRTFPPEQAPGHPLDLEATLPGKKRDVSFRRIRNFDSPWATLDLGARFRPNNQVLGCAVFSIKAEKATPLSLRLGSSGSLVVHVNGRQVLERDCQFRPLGWDQDVCSFVAEPGANLVVVKIAAQTGTLAARIRLTRPDGGPVPAWVAVSAERKDVLAAGSRKLESGAPQAVSAKLGAVTWLRRQIGREAKTPAEQHKRGMHAFEPATILAHRAEDDDSVREDRKFARIAAEQLPDFGPAHYLYGFTLDKRIGSAADREENARYQAYEAAVAAWPRYAEAMRALARMERRERSNLAKASRWIDRALRVNPKYVQACLELLRFTDASSFSTGRIVLLRRFVHDPELRGHPQMLQEYADLLEDRHQIKDALAVQQELLAKEHYLSHRADVARLQMKLGDMDGALATAEETLHFYPHTRAAYAQIAGIQEAMDNLAGAQRAWTAWLDICPEDETAMLELADLAALEGQTDKEANYLEQAVTLNTGLKEARRKLEYLKASTKRFYAGFTLDTAKLMAEDTGPDPDAAKKGDSHYYVFRHTLVRAYRDGTTSRYVHLLAKVLTEEGVNFFDVYRPPFNRQGQTARILEAKVIHSATDFEQARLGRTSWVDLPPINVGDYVEIAARVDDIGRSYFGDYFGLEHLFPAEEGVPVRLSQLDLILEPGRTYHFQTVGNVSPPVVTTLEDGSEHRRYVMKGLGRREIEERAPGPLESGPLLRVSTYGSWNEFAAWWWNLIRKQTIATPEIKAKVRELVAGQTSLEDKVRKIYEFVVTDIRYKAWEFGVHGYKPYSVGAIYARRHGDCKDKAILMNSMLHEIGVEGFPVLIHADMEREKEDLTLPLVQHFNHCITYVPEQKGMHARFLDGTAEYHPFDTLPSMDAGATVLTVHGETGEIRHIPWTNPSENRNVYSYKVALQPDGDADIVMIHEPKGQFAPSIRSRFGNEAGQRREKLADSLGRTFGEIELLDTEFSNLKVLSEPVVYSAHFKAKNFLRGTRDGYRLSSAFRPWNLSRLATAAERKSDILLSPPSGREVTIVYTAPPGESWGSIPDNIVQDTPIGRFEMTFKKHGNTLEVTRKLDLKVQRIPQALYPEFRKLTRIVDQSEARRILLRKSR